MSKEQHNTVRPSVQDTARSGGARDQLIKGHKYDGIQEYDNPMPGWWVWLFWGTIAFSVVYFVGLHVFGFINTYTDDLAERTEQIESLRAAYAAANPSFEVNEETLSEFIGNADAVENGKQHFMTYCAACHGNEGQGLIGPNLADPYWIHGGTSVDVFQVVSDGVPSAGMPAWNNVLSPEQRAEVVAFIYSVQGTDPPGAKEPQGTLVEAS